MKQGSSPRTLQYTRAFARARPEGQIVQQPGTQIPWHHHARLTQSLPAELQGSCRVLRSSKENPRDSPQEAVPPPKACPDIPFDARKLAQQVSHPRVVLFRCPHAVWWVLPYLNPQWGYERRRMTNPSKRTRLMAQLREHQAEARQLDEAIRKNLKEVGYGG